MKKTTLALVFLFIAFGLFAQQKEEEKKELKPALLVLDVQNQFVAWMEQENL